MPTSNVAVIGDRDSVLCFRAIGVEVFPVRDAEEARPIFEQLRRQEYAIVFITEPVAAEMEDQLAEVASEPFPSVILIPNNAGRLGLGMEKVRWVVRKAIGADITEREGQM